ncbi:MAG: DUF1616 domain-containing protein [Dehalococcoidales bacterium]|nr:DUF1616 domain-containing protein [Dehalococcoidales bacterium]
MNRKRVEIDLLLINFLTGILLVIVFTDSLPWLRVILSIPFIILFPGYALMGALFPGKDSLDKVNRTALSLGFSIFIVVLTGILLNHLPWGIGLHSIVLSISIFTFALSVTAWYIRGRYYPDERYNVGFKSVRLDFTNSFKPPTKVHLSLFILILCAIIAVAGGYSYMMADSSEKQPFTEFYILGIENRADSYPLELKLGERGEVTVGIVNREYEATNYRIEVVVEDNKTYELFPIVLAPEEKWHGELEFIPEPVVKRQKVEFWLYKDADRSGEVRYLWVNVKA